MLGAFGCEERRTTVNSPANILFTSGKNRELYKMLGESSERSTRCSAPSHPIKRKIVNSFTAQPQRFSAATGARRKRLQNRSAHTILAAALGTAAGAFGRVAESG